MSEQRRAKQQAEVKQHLPELYYRNGMFNQEAYRALKPRIQSWMVSPGNLYKTARPPGAIFGPPPHSTDPESPSSQLVKHAKRQQKAQVRQLERFQFKVRNEHHQVKDEREEAQEAVAEMRSVLNHRDRSPTRGRPPQ